VLVAAAVITSSSFDRNATFRPFGRTTDREGVMGYGLEAKRVSGSTYLSCYDDKSPSD
jgi:hypothetical protein